MNIFHLIGENPVASSADAGAILVSIALFGPPWDRRMQIVALYYGSTRWKIVEDCCKGLLGNLPGNIADTTIGMTKKDRCVFSNSGFLGF